MTDETEAKTPEDADQGAATHPETSDPKPSLETMKGGINAEGVPDDFEEKLVEENREYANIYRQNLLSTTAEMIKGLEMLHVMAKAGNKEARQTINVFWGLLRDAGVAFPVNRVQRRKLQALKGGKPDGDKLPA